MEAENKIQFWVTIALGEIGASLAQVATIKKIKEV